MLGVDATHLLLCSYLSNALIKRSNVNIHDFHSLVVVDVKLLIDHSWGSLDGKRLLWAL